MKLQTYHIYNGKVKHVWSVRMFICKEFPLGSPDVSKNEILSQDGCLYLSQTG